MKTAHDVAYHFQHRCILIIGRLLSIRTNLMISFIFPSMVAQIVEFSSKGYKIRKMFASEKLDSKEIIVVGRSQKVLEFDFQSQKSSESCCFLLLLKKKPFKSTFFLWTIFDNINCIL